MREVRDLRTKFPDTTFGRRLEDVGRLLRASRVLGLKRPVFLFMAGGFTAGAKRSRTLSARYQELGQALAAFYEATVEVGLEHQVTTYTDAEFPTPDDRSNSARGIRIVLGGSVTQPSIVGSEITSDNYNACLARWYGLSANDLQHLFPEVAAPGLEVLA